MMAVLAWPIVALILGIIGIFTFRRSLDGLIGRTHKLGKGLLEASPQQSVPPPVPSSTAAADAIMREFDNALLVSFEEEVRKRLAERGIAGAVERERILIRQLSATQIALHFERAYAAVFDSQLSLMRSLNSQPLGYPLPKLREWYAEIVAARPGLEPFSFETYLGYLLSNNFVVSTEDDTLQLTTVGREFLKWMLDTGKPDRGVN